MRSLLDADPGAVSFLEQSPLTSMHAPALACGSRLGNFEVLELIGQGGMGEVYRARDLRLKREVAMKILPGTFARDPTRVARLRHEAEVLAALNHPNIASIHDLMEPDGHCLLVLELVPGETLAERLARGPLPLKEALTAFRQIAQALEAAHQNGIIHRDLKPSNVKITPSGHVKLLDFGLAKLRPLAPATADPDTETQFTEPGAILGTAAYMSPEQARGQALDQRTDIWSFGCIFYEALTGRPLFSGQTPSDIIAAILRDQPVLSLPKHVPIRLRQLLESCLQRDITQRLRDIADARIQIEECLAHAPSLGGRHSRAASATTRLFVFRRRALPSRRLALFVSTAVILMLFVGYLVVRFIGTGQQEKASEAFQHARMIRVTASGQATDGAISPDGKYVAYVQRDALRLRKLDSESDLEIAPANHAHPRNLVFSPDGQRLYYTQADGTLYAIPILGGRAQQICSHLWDTSDTISFSPRGDEFVFSSFDEQAGECGLFLARADGSGKRRIAVTKFPRYLAYPAWSPRGDVIAYESTPKGFFRIDLVTQAPRVGAPVHVLTPYPWLGELHSTWIEHGGALAFSAEDRIRHQQQIWTITYPAGVLHRVTNDLDSYAGVSASADSRTLVTTRTEHTIALWLLSISKSQASEAPRPITTASTTQDGWDSLVWTPDNRIVFSSLISGSGELWIMDANGRGSGG